jgi:hypothetical protein
MELELELLRRLGRNELDHTVDDTRMDVELELGLWSRIGCSSRPECLLWLQHLDLGARAQPG